MKQKILAMLFIVALSSFFQNQYLAAQTKDYKVVFDITSPETVDHQGLIRLLNAIRKNSAGTQIEVVFYGQSLPMITKDKSTVADEVQKLAKNENISFRVCEMAMKRHGLSKSDLVPGVETVPDGVAEIVQKQGQGWGYIKAGR